MSGRAYTKSCVTCSNYFVSKTTLGKYCSRKCFDVRYRGRPQSQKCAGCRKEFVTSRINRKYCSRKCKEDTSNANRDSHSDWVLRIYGITPEVYQCMMKEQNGLCAICHEPPKEGRRLVVDHNHSTNAVRKLLCTKCNMGLGLFRDEAYLLREAANYLEQQIKKGK